MSKSDTTMSTSESEKSPRRITGDEFRTVLPGERAAVPAGLPDPEVLARMANEFFTALPAADAALSEAPYVAAATRTMEASSAATNSPGFSSVPATSLPTEAQLRALPSTLSNTGMPQQSPTFSNAALPEIPGGVSASYFTGPASLSFLEEIRPLFSYSAAAMPIAESAATIKIPTETELRAVSNSFSTTTLPQIPEAVPDRAASQVPGALVQPSASEFALSYSFLNEIRQLAPAGTGNSTEHPAAPPDGLP